MVTGTIDPKKLTSEQTRLEGGGLLLTGYQYNLAQRQLPDLLCTSLEPGFWR
jgi:hypothetical protein